MLFCQEVLPGFIHQRFVIGSLNTIIISHHELIGQDEKLDERIDYYHSAKMIPELYAKILKRYKQDYQRERSDLVKETMSLIWASRRGLSETELLEMLGKDDEPPHRAIWSSIYSATEQSLVNRSGIISFFHDYLRQAVRNKYLPIEKKQIEFHLRIADYFQDKEINPCKVDELPGQLSQAKSWQRRYE